MYMCMLAGPNGVQTREVPLYPMTHDTCACTCVPYKTTSTLANKYNGSRKLPPDKRVHHYWIISHITSCKKTEK